MNLEILARIGPALAGGADIADTSFQMWALFGIILVALVMYAMEKFAMEVISLGVLCTLMVFFHLFPVAGPDGANLLNAGKLMHGFANPALITVLALLIIGQGMVRTGVLELAASFVLRLGRGSMWISILVALVVVIVTSAFLNNIPVVVIFIPIMQALAERFNRPTSKLMMPLSFAAVLGGMTTLIGSGTNLLVSSALIELGETPFNFFDFTIPGLVLAGSGLIYVMVVMPRLLPSRSSLSARIRERTGKHFIAQITVSEASGLVGAKAVGGIIRELPNMTVRVVQRSGEDILPPFEDYAVRSGDILVVAATRMDLTKALRDDPGLLHPAEYQINGDGPETSDGERMVAEVMVTPASNMIGKSIRLTRFHELTNCSVLGVQRRSRMIRSRMTDITLAAGDMMLVQGHPTDINALRALHDVVLIEWSAEELPKVTHARRATTIFAVVVGLSASGLMPIVVASMIGALAMVAAGVLNLRQASRALDSKVVTSIVAALALGAAMQVTGGAAYLANGMLAMIGDAGPAVALSVFFLLVAVLANIISTKTCAVLFTPIAVGIANELGVDPAIFAVSVVFAANCAFATPIAYQTSLLVMGPGHYRFKDFLIAGSPLLIWVWLVFSIFAPWYYGL